MYLYTYYLSCSLNSIAHMLLLLLPPPPPPPCCCLLCTTANTIRSLGLFFFFHCTVTGPLFLYELIGCYISLQCPTLQRLITAQPMFTLHRRRHMCCFCCHDCCWRQTDNKHKLPQYQNGISEGCHI